MDDLLAMFQSGMHEFSARVHAVGDDQWGAATPDDQWTVAQLVEHVIDEHRWAAPLMHGQDLESAAKVVEGSRSLPVDGGVGANLAQGWDEAATGSAEAFTAPGALEREVELSRGTTPVSSYLEEMIFDLVVHAWDLGRAIDYREPLPDDLVSAVHAAVLPMGDLSAYGEMFRPPVEVPDDAPTIDKLVAATGRDPHWTASPSD
ncbi:MAG: TIGR03086 family protein [Pseudonocardiales bacterium]|nr:MAG: TIGR03086 family protein [Pseudonocardiales bacterium]